MFPIVGDVKFFRFNLVFRVFYSFQLLQSLDDCVRSAQSDETVDLLHAIDP